MSLIYAPTPTWLGGIMPSTFNDPYADQFPQTIALIGLQLPALSWRGGCDVAPQVAIRMAIGDTSITGEAQ